MTIKNNGINYEKFVCTVQNLLLNSDSFNTINVIQNKHLIDNSGIRRQFDIYWEFTLGGIVYKNVIECKDYSSKISMEKIDAFKSKIGQFPGVTGIFATTSGYQKGAQELAKKYNIPILVIREPQKNDWTLNDNSPLIRAVDINFTVEQPAKILSFTPKLNAPPKNEGIRHALTSEIIIYDNNEKYSLRILSSRLAENRDAILSKYIEIKNGFLEINKEIIPITGFYIKYQTFKNIVESISMDSIDHTLAYIENPVTGERKFINKNGECINLNTI